MNTQWFNFFQLKYVIGLIKKKKKINSNSFSDNVLKYFFVEVDLDYHDEFSDYPLEPVKIKVTKEMSEYQLQIIKE